MRERIRIAPERTIDAIAHSAVPVILFCDEGAYANWAPAGRRAPTPSTTIETGAGGGALRMVAATMVGTEAVHRAGCRADAAVSSTCWFQSRTKMR